MAFQLIIDVEFLSRSFSGRIYQNTNGIRPILSIIKKKRIGLCLKSYVTMIIHKTQTQIMQLNALPITSPVDVICATTFTITINS